MESFKTFHFSTMILVMKSATVSVIGRPSAGKSVESVSRDTERDCWLTANEALEYGIVSRIITRKSEI